MKKVALADVLWEAANKRLSPTVNEADNTVDRYSCYAVSLAATGAIYPMDRHSYNSRPERLNTIMDFLYSLGLEYYAEECDWSGFSGEVIQGVRYMWLLLAMHVAEDEGIEIEVNA